MPPSKSNGRLQSLILSTFWLLYLPWYWAKLDLALVHPTLILNLSASLAFHSTPPKPPPPWHPPWNAGEKYESKHLSRYVPGVSLCSPPALKGDVECVGLSSGGRRLYLCGDGVLGLPVSGLHLLRLGDWGLRRASNSMERFNVAPQAMFGKQNRGGGNNTEENTRRKPGVWRSSVSSDFFSGPFFLPTTTDLLRVVSQVLACWIFKTSQWRLVPFVNRGGFNLKFNISNLTRTVGTHWRLFKNWFYRCSVMNSLINLTYRWYLFCFSFYGWALQPPSFEWSIANELRFRLLSRVR